MNLREDHNIPVRAGEILRLASLPYVLVTAAHNEELYIERTIKSVISQTILPLRWVIVDDGSTDGTGQIVAGYQAEHPWIELRTMPTHVGRQFGAKAICFNAGYRSVSSRSYEIIGNVDADISFKPDHMEYLLSRFAEDPALGVAGTPMREDFHDPVRDGIFNQDDVFGACQLFRRACLDRIGGYVPLKGGGMDVIAVRTARLQGWKTRSFMDRTFFHHRAMGATDGTIWTARYSYGKKDYALGNGYLWETARVIYQLTRKPYVIGGLLLLAGYMYALISRQGRAVSKELMEFLRKEQRARLRNVVSGVLRPDRAGR